MQFRVVALSLAAAVVVVPLTACPGRSAEGEGEGEEGEGEEGEGEEGEGEEGEGEEGEGEPVDPTCKTGEFTWPVETHDVAITPSDGIKTRLDPFGEFEPFIYVDFDAGASQARTAKGVVLVEDPDTVYFQDSNVERFHGEFARAHLDPFTGLSQQAFDAVSLREQNQQAILVTLLFPGSPTVHEVGLQLVRAEPYHPAQAIQILNLLKDSIEAPEGTQFFYIPTFEQQRCATSDDEAAAYAAAGFPVSDAGRFIDGAGACYARGWAIGTLVHSNDPVADYAAGTLTDDDVLLIDQVPAELPLTAGVLTFAAATPASHVAILANQYALPFASIFDEQQRADVLALVGQRVLVQTAGSFNGCHAEVFDAAALPAPEQTRLLANKITPPIEVVPPRAAGVFVKDVADLDVADRDIVGGKAANYTVLRTAVADNAPAAAAVTFDAYDAFFADAAIDVDSVMAAIGSGAAVDAATALQQLPPLRNQVVAHRLNATDAAVLLAALAERFDPNVKLRFRSSTNAEDGESFTAAGLYDSFSGCVADDLDDDDVGPSRCNPDQAEERGALRAMARVYASFFNDNAVLERRRREIDEADVKMGMLVHPSFDDDIEEANGVAVVRDNGFGANIELIVQQGALSVTNPEGGAVPERVRVDVFSGGAFVTLLQSSSLVAQGATVMQHDFVSGAGDYTNLGNHLQAVADAWRAAQNLDDNEPFVLDLEFKKVGGGVFDPDDHLVIKQVRNFPQPSSARDVPVAVLPTDDVLCPLEAEGSDVFAIHRAKSRIHVLMQGRVLDDVGAASAFIDGLDADFVDDGAVVSIDDAFADLADHAYAVDSIGTHHSFRVADRVHTITTTFTAPQSLTEPPFRPFVNTGLDLTTRYDSPVAFYGFDDLGQRGITTRSEESVPLAPCTLDDAAFPGEVTPRFDYRAESPDHAIVVDPHFFWPPEPTGITAGYTAPTVRWGTTTITGLIAQTITLSSPWSQTSRPEHHNFGVQLIFEPRLEPGIAPEIVAALEAIDVIALHIDSAGQFFAIGADGNIRPIGGTTLP